MRVFKKLLFFIFISFHLYGNEIYDDEWHSNEMKLRNAQYFYMDCLKLNELRNTYCNSNKKNIAELTKNLPSANQCQTTVQNLFSKEKGLYEYKKKIDAYIKSNSKKFKQEIKKEFLDYERKIPNSDLNCTHHIRYLAENFTISSDNLISEPTPFLNEIGADVLVGEEFENYDIVENTEEYLKLFEKYENLDDVRFLFILESQVSLMFPQDVRIALLSHIVKSSKISALSDYAESSLDDESKTLLMDINNESDFYKFISDLKYTKADLEDPNELFALMKKIVKEVYNWQKTTITTYEINKIVDNYNIYTNPFEPVNRLNKLKNHTKEKISFEFIVTLMETFEMIEMPAFIMESWLDYLRKTSNDAREKQFAIEALEYLNSNEFSTPLWLESNGAFYERFKDKNIIDDLAELRSLTYDFINDYQSNVSVALSGDLLSAAYIFSDGDGEFLEKDFINDYAAQVLGEEALKVAKIENNFDIEKGARAFLSSLFFHSRTENIRNPRLAKIHLEEALHTWIDHCKNHLDAKSPRMLIECANDETLLDIEDVEISNVLQLIYEGENLYQYDEYITQLHELFKMKSELHIDHLSNEIKSPKEFDDHNDFLSYLSKEYKSTQDERLLELRCHYMLDRPNLIGVDNTIDCYEKLIEVTINTSNKELTIDLDYSGINHILSTLYKYKSNKYVKFDNFDMEDYYNYKFQQSDIKDVNEQNNDGRFALVIGNSDYEENLKSPTRDANQIAKKLTELGFKVTKHIDLDSKSFKEKLIEFGLKTKNSSTVLFYFSGHAYESGGKNYLLPIDISFNNNIEKILATSIDLNKVMQKNISGKTKLIFLDACRNNPFNKNGLAAVNLGNNTLVSFAAGFNQYSFTGKDLSPYTASLIKNMRPQKSITKTLRQVRKEVREITKNKQIPEEYSNLDEVILY